MVAADLPIGDRIRHYRTSKGRQQDVVAGLVGITADYLSQIERGLRVPSIDVLYAIARELGVPVAALLADAPTLTLQSSDSSDPAITQTLMGYGPPRSSPAATPAELRERVERAWRSWQTSANRFTDAATVLPDLIGDVEHAVRVHRPDAATHRETLRVAADMYFLLRSYLRRAGRVDLSMMVADRAVRAAEDADDPLRIAAAQWNMGHVLLATGETDGAEQVAVRATKDLAPSIELGDDAAVAMTGALQLVTVVAAARRKGGAWTARQRLREAARIAALTPDNGNVMWTVFCPTNIALHRVSIEMEAGEAGEGLRMADEVDTRGLPSLERLFTFGLEVARCYDLRRDDPAVLLHLLELERLAPEDLERNPLARTIVLSLIRRARTMHARQAEALATRMGVL